ncbi:MAG: response regulator transcription factor [Myxococcota bacterium]
MFEPLPVVLVADDPLVRAGLSALMPEMAVVVAAIGTDAVAEQVGAAGAHVVVWDADDHLPLPAELDLGVPVVVLVRSAEDGARIEGAAALLRRDTDAGRLGAALIAVRAGLRCTDDRLPVSARSPAIEGDGPREPLTARELEVLGLLAEGRSNREIATALDISVHTSKFHVDRILSKLEASSRTDAVVRAVRLGLLTL